MKVILCGVLLSCILGLCVSCGNDPLSSENMSDEFGGTLTMGSGGINAPASELNKESLSQIVIDQVYAAYARGFRAIVTGDAEPGQPFRVTGNSFGNADTEGFDKLVQFGTSDEIAAGIGGYDYSFELTFHNFSSTGIIFLGGKLNFEGSMRLVGENWIPRDIYVTKAVAFAGNFKGSAMFDNLLIPLDSAGRFYSVNATVQDLQGHPYNGSLILSSGDVSIRFNPYYREQRPPDGQGGQM